jgi:hypothetical protein
LNVRRLEAKVASGTDRDGSAQQQLEELEAKAKALEATETRQCWRSVGHSFLVSHCRSLLWLAIHQRGRLHHLSRTPIGQERATASTSVE